MSEHSPNYLDKSTPIPCGMGITCRSSICTLKGALEHPLHAQLRLALLLGTYLQCGVETPLPVSNGYYTRIITYSAVTGLIMWEPVGRTLTGDVVRQAVLQGFERHVRPIGYNAGDTP